MENSLQFAAVDIGSNAIRLFFGYVFETKKGPVFKKASLIRLPIRLGEDSFHKQPIQESKIEELIDAMHAFNHLKKAYKVIDYRVCATSAMRDAMNSKQVIARVKKETGIDIELIDGDTEAALIYDNHIAEELDSDEACIYMDVGGGSTEFSLYKAGSKVASKSFNIGTIRLKDDLVSEEYWLKLKSWLNNLKVKYKPKYIIGSGGNINTIFKLSGQVEMKPLSMERIKKWHRKLKVLSYDEKIAKLNLRPDRADVIVPATELFLFAMSKSGCKEVIVPKVGLVDGIVHQLYEKYKQN